MTSLPDVLLVTGTDTDVGKTVATAAISAVVARRSGRPVSVYKCVQTGVRDSEPGDAATVATLTWETPNITCTEGARFTSPMAPVAAARRDRAVLPPLTDHVDRILELSSGSVVVVEGSGGLLVPLDGAGASLADVPAAVAASDFPLRVEAVVVCRPDLGTLNHTMLTLEALSHRGVPVAGMILGSWPRHPQEVHRSNREVLQSLGPPLWGAIPEGSGTMESSVFVRHAASWLPDLAVSVKRADRSVQRLW